MKIKNRKEYRNRRHLRLRRKIVGTARRPRMCVSVSNRYIRVQIIDDETASTVLAVCSRGMDEAGGGKNVAAARRIGETIGRMAVSKGIENVVYDRGGRAYHGRVKAVAEAVREAGIRL